MAETIGSGVSKTIIDQIKSREELFGKNSKTTSDIIAINSNAAWVKLRSSVNQITQQEANNLKLSKDTRNNIGNPEYAKNFILVGGTKGINTVRSGISRQPNVIDAQKAYQNYADSLGFRPMPGITSLNVKSKNTYGTLQEAEVQFAVWSREDLEICELLYFRPGYTALLEWGHSVFVDDKGRVMKAGTDTYTVSDDAFFSPSGKTGNSTAGSVIENKIQYHRTNSFGNYEALFGYITNFSWSFRSDGGYDCTVKIISRGAILDSLKVGKTSDNIPEGEISRGDKEKGKRERKSPFHYIFSKLDGVSSGAQFDGKQQLLKAGAKKASSELQPFQVFRTNTDIDREGGLLSMIGVEKSVNLQYVPLRVILDIFNKFATIKDPLKKEDITRFSTRLGTKFLTFPSHFSTDPIVAVTPKQPESIINLKKGTSVETRTNPFSITKDSLHKLMTEYVGENFDDILNIMVSTRFVESQLDNVLNGDQEQSTGIFDAIKNILSGIQNALGEINRFDIYYDSSLNEHIIIDRELFNLDITTPDIPTIQITGLKSTVQNIEISSKISGNIASQVAIAAQGGSGNYSDNIATILEWNSGAIDRHIPIKDQSDSTTDTQDEGKQSDFLLDLIDVYDSFNDVGGWRTNQKYDGELFNQLKSESIGYLQKKIKQHIYAKGQTPQGVIPVELSLTMLGIGGFKVGTVFKIPSFLLPSKYDSYGFIVTGVEHSIGQDNKWTTQLRTQFFSLRKPDSDSTQVAKSKTVTSSSSTSVPRGTTPLTNTLLNDPAPTINPGKIGAVSYSNSNLAKSVAAAGGKNGILNIKDPKFLVFIGETAGAAKYYINPTTGKPEYMLNPKAAQAWFRWRDDMRAKSINYSITSAYRSTVHQSGIGGGNTVAKPGTSPHGWGGALDFGNLYRIVGGSGNTQTNLNGRKTEEYRKLAESGAKFGWYNPWRLSDNVGVDEIWHFEYWG